ncbi:MAG: HD domain-containing protein [Nitrospirae bacterium]|nr:HD domain-containing protein [Nitrospirota bacterium]
MPLTEEKKTYQEAKDLINSLAITIKTAQIHNPNNVAVVAAIEKFLSLANPIIKAEKLVTLDLINEFFYLNEARVRYSLEYIINFDFLSREFKKRELGTLTFNDIPAENDIKIFLKAFIEAGFSETPFETLSEAVDNIERIKVGKLKKIKEEGEFDRKKFVKKTYFNAVSFTKGVMTKIKAGEKISLKKAKRVVETVVDLILEEESLLLGMTALKDYDEYTYHHSVNVSILSVALGQRLGLRRKALTDLGMSSLFHDMGKIEVPSEILNKASEFSEGEWEIMRQHPLWGVRAILKLKGFDDISLRTAIVAFEHHLNYNLSGYPKLRNTLKPDLFSKIVTIADQYDAMTSSRVYSRTPVAPDRALSIMVDRSGTQLDPYLTKLFINMVGIHPIGSLVMLNTKELGLVFESNPNPDFLDRPRVIIVVDSKGNRIKQNVDLMEKDDADNFKRSIVTTLDPNQYRVNLAEYLL